MSGFGFDSNIIIEALVGYPQAAAEIKRAFDGGRRGWISRMMWAQALSKGSEATLKSAEALPSGFGVDELDAEIAVTRHAECSHPL